MTPICRRVLFALVGIAVVPAILQAGAGFFAPSGQKVSQVSQRVFITWDPEKKVESFTIQPRFQGNAADFAMIVPTPTMPAIREMPHDFFKELEVFTLLKRRAIAGSLLLPVPKGVLRGTAPTPITVLQSGLIGSLDYKIIEAAHGDDLSQWLKDNNYNYAAEQATLDSYVDRKFVFTVLKIHPVVVNQVVANPPGAKGKAKATTTIIIANGEVAPLRFEFASDRPMYPLKVARSSITSNGRLDVSFYIEAPFKADFPDDLSYQYGWAPMLESALRTNPDGLPGAGHEWFRIMEKDMPALNRRARELGYISTPVPPGKGTPAPQIRRTPTRVEWAKRLNAGDMRLLRGELPYGDTMPDVDIGFTRKDIADTNNGAMVRGAIEDRLEAARKRNPNGYLVRAAPQADIRQLQQLSGQLQEGLFLTKLRKTFTREELADDLNIIPARHADRDDTSEYDINFAAPAYITMPKGRAGF